MERIQATAPSGATGRFIRPVQPDDRSVLPDTAPGFIRALCQTSAYAHPVSGIRLVETHISWVLLTGVFAYKIKKPVNPGFLDFSTLEKRKQACEDELRLNRRFAPEIYLEVVPITGSEHKPRMNSAGEAFEYAVRMREFPQSDQLDRVLDRGQLGLEDMDRLARQLASFHAAAPVAPANSRFGLPGEVHRPVRENIEALLADTRGDQLNCLQILRDWTEMRYAVLQAAMTLRKDGGFIREVHGDLHLANLVRLGYAIVPFDCIEFSEDLRWIDVLSDIAFLLMDLQFHGRSDLAYRLLNQYLDHTGDYAALRLLPYYRVYRALVRAKVAKLRREGSAGITRRDADLMLHAFIDHASRWAAAPAPCLILMHGLSGSGKSWLSDQLATQLPAIRLRSDIERKRIHGVGAHAASGSALGSGIYSQAASLHTYERLAELACATLEAGETVLVDAAFLRSEQRDWLLAEARKLCLPFGILVCEASPAELERRLERRTRTRQDPSEAGVEVLTHQRRTMEPLTAEEQSVSFTVDTTELADVGALMPRIRNWIGDLAPAGPGRE